MSGGPILTVERRGAIADVVVEQGAARVSELSERFDVSPATVRRDLEALEDGGRLRRVHGGAIAVDDRAGAEPAQASPSEQTSTPRPDGAARIGETVAEMIGEGETVFLGPGALPFEVARNLKHHPTITVITNGLDIAHWLATNTRHRLIITGGQFEERSMGLVGQMTRRALSDLRADRVIVELDGVSPVEGLTQDSLPQAEIAQLLIETGARVVVLVPAERVGRVAATLVAPVSSADAIVTGREASAAYLWDLSEVGIEIVLA